MKLFSIPSPGDPFLFRFHGLQARWYGLILALAVLLAGWIARKEFRRRKIDPELVYTIAVWTVPFGLVGARLYHVVTDWGAFSPGHYSQIPQIWQGGLGIWGAVLGGMVGTLIGVRRAKLPFWVVADCIAPGLILAQALGRWGNYFNQERTAAPAPSRGRSRSTIRPSPTTSSAGRTRSYPPSCTSRCGLAGVLHPVAVHQAVLEPRPGRNDLRPLRGALLVRQDLHRDAANRHRR